MATFKQYMAAKTKVNEQQVPKTMNKNYFIRKEINEGYDGEASTEGGEIDAMLVAVGAAAALAAKAMWNASVYTRLKGELPGYIKQYKITQAPQSRAVFDFVNGKNLAELKKQKAILMGTGGSREDQDVRGQSKEELSAKARVEKMFKAKLDSAEGNPKARKQINAQKEAALQKIDEKIQALQNKIEQLQDKLEVSWEKAKEDWRQFDEKWKAKEEGKLGWIEVRDSPLASSYRKRWDKEFTIAKKQADIEVLEEAKKIASESKNKKELEAIQKAEERAKEAQAKAEEALGEVESDADAADREMADAKKFGIDQYVAAAQAKDAVYSEANAKWQKESQKGESDGGGKKDALNYKIEKAEEKLKKAKDAIGKVDDEEKKKKIEAAAGKIENDIKSYKEELSKIGESENFSDFDFYSLSTRLVETDSMIDNLCEEYQLFESNKPEVGSYSTITKAMSKAINNAPDEERKSIASDAFADLEKMKGAELNLIKARNEMAKKFEDNDSKDEKDQDNLPKGYEGFKKYKEVDPKEVEEKYNTFSEILKKDHGAEKPKEEPKDKEGEEETEDTQGNDEKIAAAEEEVETAKADVDTAKGEKEKADQGEDEAAKIDAEISVVKAEIAWRQAKQKVAKLKGDDELVQGSGDDIGTDMEKIQSLENKKKELADKKEAENDSPEVKEKKLKVEELKANVEEIKTGIKEVKDKDTKGALQAVLPAEEKKLAKAEEELEAAKNKGKESSEKSESVETDIPSKFMKFEDFLNLKVKNK